MTKFVCGPSTFHSATSRGCVTTRGSLVVCRQAAVSSFFGDLNADPVDGDSHNTAINQLLQHPRVNGDFAPQSAGAVAAATAQGRANLRHKGSSQYDTGDFSDRVVGNLKNRLCAAQQRFDNCEGGRLLAGSRRQSRRHRQLFGPSSGLAGSGSGCR